MEEDTVNTLIITEEDELGINNSGEARTKRERAVNQSERERERQQRVQRRCSRKDKEHPLGNEIERERNLRT